MQAAAKSQSPSTSGWRARPKTGYNYLTLIQAGALAPKESGGRWKKFEPARVRAYVAQHLDATLRELGRAFHGTDVGV